MKFSNFLEDFLEGEGILPIRYSILLRRPLEYLLRIRIHLRLT